MADDDQRATETDGGGEYRDELPADLDVTGYVGPYLFPTMERRRIPATMYVVLAALCIGGYAISSNGGLLAAAIVLALIALYHYASAWPLNMPRDEVRPSGDNSSRQWLTNPESFIDRPFVARTVEQCFSTAV